MMRRTNGIGWVLGMGLALAAPGWSAAAQSAKYADPTTRPRPAVRSESSILAEMQAQIASPDAATRKQAIEAIRERLNATPARSVDTRSFLRVLLQGKHYDEAADLAMSAILAIPADTRSVEHALQSRIRALLAAGKATDALADAKSLYNVCSMEGTSEAILLVAECLIAARPTERDAYEKFKAEQMAGASTQPSGARAGEQTQTLASIKVNAQPYLDAAKRFAGEDYPSLLCRGNLMLLADRPKEAKTLFERMYTLAKTPDLPEASECLARSMRAEDGAIGRANAWVLSIRPRKPTP